MMGLLKQHWRGTNCVCSRAGWRGGKSTNKSGRKARQRKDSGSSGKSRPKFGIFPFLGENKLTASKSGWLTPKFHHPVKLDGPTLQLARAKARLCSPKQGGTESACFVEEREESQERERGRRKGRGRAEAGPSLGNLTSTKSRNERERVVISHDHSVWPRLAG